MEVMWEDHESLESIITPIYLYEMVRDTSLLLILYEKVEIEFLQENDIILHFEVFKLINQLVHTPTANEVWVTLKGLIIRERCYGSINDIVVCEMAYAG